MGAFVVFVVSSAVPSVARAEDPKPPVAQVQVTKPKLGEKNEPLFFGLDVAVGLGTRPSVLQLPPTPTNPTPGNGIVDTGHRAGTFLVKVHYSLKNFGFGVRFPIIAGRVYDNDNPRGFGDSRFYSGNVEFVADAPRQLSDTIRFLPSISVLAPTAGGTAFETGDDVSSTSYDRGGAQRYSLGLASAYARGGEDNALFLNHRLGIVPKVGFDFTFGRAEIAPFLKIPVMVAVQESTNEPLRLEVVGGIRFAYWLGPVSVGVRALGNVPIASKESLRDPWFFLEPELRFQITPDFRAYLSGLLPMAGPYTVFETPSAGTIRGGFNVTF